MSLAVVLFSACRINRPSDVLSPKEMEKYLYDYHLAQGIISNLPQDRKYEFQALNDWALAKNGFSNEQIERSLVWYTRYPGEFAKIYKKLNRRIDAEYKESQNIKARIEKRSFSVGSGDSVSLWYLDSVTILNSSRYMSRLTMEQIGGESFQPYDTVRWNGIVTLFCSDSVSSSRLYLAMTLAYKDSISTLDTVLYGPSSGPVFMSLVLDQSKSMESVRFLAQFMEDSENDSRGMAVISNVDMKRYHNRKDSLSIIPDTTLAIPQLTDSVAIDSIGQ